MPHPTPLDERLEYIADREAWRQALPPPPVPDFLTGLKLRPPDPRDHLMPGADEKLVAVPDTFDITRDFPGPVLNQGAVPSCVCHTMSHQQCIFQWQEEKLARVFDAQRAHNETGPVGEGRFPDDILRYAKDRGMPLSGAETRYRIASYAFAPKITPEIWAGAIKAAIAGGQPVPICYLLPSVYGWESSGNITSGYHETLIVGYDAGRFLMLNSWGTGWGRNGLGWVPIPFLTQSNWQNGYVIAHSSVADERSVTPDPPQPQPNPQPQPVDKVFVSGEALGGGLEMLHVGSVLQAAGEGFSGTLRVSEVMRKPQPPLPPDPPIPPDPAGLVIEVYRQRAVLGVRIKSPTGHLAGRVEARLGNAPLTSWSLNRTTPFSAALFTLLSYQHGALTITAVTDDGRTVTRTETV